MHITIITAGSRGDVQPFIALGKGIVEAGHQVRLLAPENFESVARENGLDFYATYGDIQAIMQSEKGQQLMRSGVNPFGLLNAMRDMVEPIAKRATAEIEAATKNTDLMLLYSVASLFAQPVAGKYNIPFMVASPVPIMPTREKPAALWMSQQSFGGVYNYWTGTLVLKMMWWLFADFVNDSRQKMGLAPNNLKQITQLYREAPFLGGFSPTVYPKPDDWLEHFRITGYWFLDETQWTPPTDLVDFLNAGEPPVYIGFGSMVNQDPEETTQIVLEAIAKSGKRGLLLTGWGGMSAMNVPDNVFVIENAPHSWLFPKMSAVVHHGGAGTTAAGLRAGVPSIIVPFIADQPFWGKHVYDLGVGSKPIPRKKLTADKLAQAIQQTTQPAMIKRASEIGEKIRAEDGIGQTIRYIEHYLGVETMSRDKHRI